MDEAPRSDTIKGGERDSAARPQARRTRKGGKKPPGGRTVRARMSQGAAAGKRTPRASKEQPAAQARQQPKPGLVKERTEAEEGGDGGGDGPPKKKKRRA